MISRGEAALGALWGKSDAGGRVNLLVQHLLDTAAVAELIWDHYLAPAVRARIDACCPGRGRLLFVLLCGLHDVGKATPAFQGKDEKLAQRVRAAGLDWRGLTARDVRRWHHTIAGAVILKRVLAQVGWSDKACAWVWPLIAGHHGRIPGEEHMIRIPARGHAHGQGPEWEVAQRAVVDAVADALGTDLAELAPQWTPRRAEQLAIVGGIIMADWIASADRLPGGVSAFTGIDRLEAVSMAAARQRAQSVWAALKLRGGWTPEHVAPGPDLIQPRFARSARAAQTAAVALAEQLPSPGLLMLEAPMGEGKTEAALVAAEVLARRFGADGVFVGMPTQATSDQMFTRVLAWAASVDSTLPVGLLHGKRRFNREWVKLQQEIHFGGVDEYGCEHDPLGIASAPAGSVSSDRTPAEWFLGHHRGLLIPLTVGTIDQLLHAATRTRFVMLRQAGLAGRVVILDEVHAYDVYMAEFLFEALRWLADAGVPVILLSATLPPVLRAKLANAYLQGVTGTRAVDLSGMPEADAYPVARSMCVVDGEPRFGIQGSRSWRPSIPVAVQQHNEDPAGEPEKIAKLLSDALVDGGCALVVRNTVGRAQQTYTALKQTFGDDVVLLHGRLTAAERANRTEKVVEQLGPSEHEDTLPPEHEDVLPRPHRLVVVATQLAEQSFDVDVDLLVTDLAPIDLLLQRIGRLHRHDRAVGDRPARLQSPQVVIVGMKTEAGRAPVFPPGSQRVYDTHMLLRSAALVLEGAGKGWWSIPGNVPDLVRRGYGDDPLVPEIWQEAARTAAKERDDSQRVRRAAAASFLLAGEDNLGWPTLEGLHERQTRELEDDDAVAAVVRDGDESIEVVLVQHDGRGYRMLGDRRWMGVHGEAVSSDPDIAEAVVGATVRLPAYKEITDAARSELRPLPGWDGDAWLRRARALVLDDAGSAQLGGHRLTYDHELGLLDERAP